MRLSICLFICSIFLSDFALAKESTHYQVLETISHDSSYFTQGLELSNGVMFESSGLYGQSRIRKYLPANDKTLLETPLEEKYFAEGLTLLANELFVLTWKENTAFVLNPDDLSVVREMTYDGQGWGLANNGKQIIMSNGSNTIYFRDPTTFEIRHEIDVYSEQHPVRRINELEYAEGYIWANIWHSSLIVKINPISGELIGFYDMATLVEKNTAASDRGVLNGIAYDADEKAFWITGKLWPERYLVKFGSPQKIQ